jgi:perosamine synthetase
VGPGDDVVVPSLSFIATANAPRYVGARPVFADVELESQNVTAETVADALTPATRAVIVVDQAGMPADVDAIEALCAPRGVTVIEDAACAIGSTYRGRPVGGGRLVALSFHPRKLVTTGEGGMLLTPDAELAARLRRLREHGMAVSALERHGGRTVVLEQYAELGFNFRMTDLQAAIGLAQFDKLDAMVAERRRLADGYRAALAGVPGLAVMQALLEQGIATRRGIMAAHLEPACTGLSAPPLPVTERLTAESLILPLFHGMTREQLERVAEALAVSVARPSRTEEAAAC